MTALFCLLIFFFFFKAFNTISHHGLWSLGFGEKFQKVVKTLYKGCNSSVNLTCGTTPRFCLNRGIFLITQVMAVHIKKEPTF